MQKIYNLVFFCEEKTCLREKIQKMDEVFMHLKEVFLKLERQID